MKISKADLMQFIKEEIGDEYEEEEDPIIGLIKSGDSDNIKQALELLIHFPDRLTGADLSDAVLRHAKLDGIKLRSADLTNAELYYTFLRGADLTDANLTNADLTNAYLNRANLTNANLTDADLKLTRLSGADLSGADLTGAKNLESSVHYRTYYNKETIWPVGFDPTIRTKYKIFIFKDESKLDDGITESTIRKQKTMKISKAKLIEIIKEEFKKTMGDK